MIMLGAVLPSYDSAKNADKQEDVIRADDPKNRDAVNRFFDNID
jgi:hypothetical protein